MLATINLNKFIKMAIIAILVLAIGIGIFLKFSISTLILDVNPSIELKTNGLRRVIHIEPLNEDGKKLLEGFELKDRNIETVVEELIDRMILTGYIAGGEDNLVMITVDDNKANKDMVEKVNKAISAYLENKQMEAAILNQTIDMKDDDVKLAKEKNTSPGKLKIIERIMANDKSLTYEQLISIRLKDLISSAVELGIDPEDLFDSYVGLISKKDKYKPEVKVEVESVSKSGKDKGKNVEKERISLKEAKDIALKLANGKITDFELDRDDGRLIYEIEIKAGKVEHEIEIDAYTGKVLKHEKDDDYKSSGKKTKKISAKEAKDIALKLANGKITEFELDEDDGRLIYEIEIKEGKVEHEIEMDAYTGEVIKHERDWDD